MTELVFNPFKEIAHYFLYIFLYGLKEFGVPRAVRRHIILHSGRGVTKSTFFAIWNIFRLLFYDNADGVSLTFNKTDIKDTTWKVYLKALKIMKLRENIDYILHEGGVNGEWYILIRNNFKHWNKIFFRGCNAGAESMKGFEPEIGHRFLFVSMFELTEFVNWGAKDLTTLHSTFMRSRYVTYYWDKIREYCKENNIVLEEENVDWLIEQKWYRDNETTFTSNEFCFEYEFNTPSHGAKWWVMDWLETMKLRPDVFHQFNTYLDMTERERFKFNVPMDEVNGLKETNPIVYNHEWLGQEDLNTLSTFPGLAGRHLGRWSPEEFQPDKITIGVDVGTEDPTVCTATGIQFDRKDLKVEVMHTWAFGKVKATYVKDSRILPFPVERTWSMYQYGQFIRDFCDYIHSLYPTVPLYFQMERRSSGKAFFEETFKYNGGMKYLNRATNNEWDMCGIEQGVQTLTSLMLCKNDVFRISDEFTFKTLRNLINDKKKEEATGQVKPLDNTTTKKSKTIWVDIFDAIRYSFSKSDYKLISDRLRDNGGKFNAKKQAEQDFIKFIKS